MEGKIEEKNRAFHHWAPVFRRFVKYRFKRGERYGLAFTIAFAIVVAAAWLFLELVESIADQTNFYQFDFAVQGFIRDLLNPALTSALIFITDLGGTTGTVAGALLLGVFLLYSRRWWELFGLVFATAGGGLVLAGLKLFFARARPAEKLVDAGGFSFPSGHALAAMVLFGYVIYLAWHSVHNRIWRAVITVASALMILLIGASRVYLNVHWFTDVLGGFAAGFVWLWLSIHIVRTVEAPPWRKPRHHLHLPHLHSRGQEGSEGAAPESGTGAPER